jgi:hypothetical protein
MTKLRHGHSTRHHDSEASRLFRGEQQARRGAGNQQPDRLTFVLVVPPGTYVDNASTTTPSLQALPLPVLPIQCAALLQPDDLRIRILQILLQHLHAMLPEQRGLQLRQVGIGRKL